MADRGSTRLFRRPASKAGRLLLWLLGGILAVPLWLAWLLMVLLLPFARPLVQFPLALAVAGGFGAGIYFAITHAWADAFFAAFIGAGSAVVLAAFTSLAQRIDPEFARPTPFPPWWWYF